MATRVKCFHCLGCMIARWYNNQRYYYCDLCKVWYGGGKELIEVPDPTIIESEKNDIPDNANS